MVNLCESTFASTGSGLHRCKLLPAHEGCHTSGTMTWDTIPRMLDHAVTQDEKRFTFSSGAQRSEQKSRYDLIPQCALKRIADRFQLGLKYGEHNYKKGLPFDDTLNHIIDHLLSYKERRKTYFQLQESNTQGTETLEEYMTRTEPDGDDLGAAAWGCVTLIWLEENGKLL